MVDDGYRVHVNPDNSCIFLEGKNNYLPVLTHEVSQKIDQTMAPEEDTPRMRRLSNIIRLERAYAHENDW
jgi:hypothetical protein